MCHHVLPIDCFRRRYRGRDDLRDWRCNDCRKLQDRIRRARSRDKACFDFAAELSKTVEMGKVFELCRQMFRRFRGPANFAVAWFSAFEAARKRYPGSTRVTDTLQAVLRLAEICGQAKTPLSDLSLMSDSDLQRLHRKAMSKLIGAGGE